MKLLIWYYRKKIKNGTMRIYGQNRITMFDFMNFSEIFGKLEMNTDSIKAVLMALYINTNLVGDSYIFFDKDWIERDGIEGLCSRIDQNQCMVFNAYTTQKIVELSEYYSEYMVDEIYSNVKLQYVLFNKRNFKSAVDDMIQSAYFDAFPYMKIIKDNYRKIAARFTIISFCWYSQSVNSFTLDSSVRIFFFRSRASFF